MLSLPSPPSWARAVSLGAGWVAAAVGITALMGWVLGEPILTTLATGATSMKINSAVSLVLLGLSLVIVIHRPSAHAISAALAVFVLVIALLTIGEFATGRDFRIDTALFPWGLAAAPGDLDRMSFATALALAFAAGALLTVHAPSVSPKISQGLAQACLVVVAIAIVGYLYGVEDLYEFGPYASVALHTAATLGVLAIGILLIRPDVGILAHILAPGPGGTMIRTLLPSTTILPIVLGLLILAGSRIGFYQLEFAIAILVIVIIVLLRAIVFRTAAMIDETDRMRQQATDEARRSADRQRLIMRTIADAVVIIDETSQVEFVNEATERLFGYTEFEMIGHPLTMLMPERFRERHRVGLTRYLTTGERGIAWEGVELVGLHSDGHEFPIDVAFADALEDGRRSFIGTIRDITARKILEDQLLQAQRLESVGRLAGGIAHDFNNVLTAILGFAQLMLQELPEDDPQRQNAEVIEDAANRATTLVRQLLAFGRQQVLRPEVLDIGEVVRGVTSMLDRLLGEDVQISLLPASGGWLIEADRSQLEQVIVNLAVNARDAMPRGGRLTIETSNIDLGADYARIHPEVTPGPHVMLAVSDTGFGMDAETQAHIFEPFFTTKGPSQGTGLGLATVYGIVRQSGGHIWVDSEPDRGTTFRVYFPRATHAAEPEAEESVEPGSAAGTETILVAEDEESLRVLLGVVLRRLGYRVLIAEDAKQALAIVGRERIDLLVTDIVMPGQSGLDLADAVRRQAPEVGVLYMSGYTEAALESHGRFRHGEGLLEKPFTPETLGAAVRRELDGPLR